MGRQWLLAKREVASLRKSQATGKFIREITIAARHGGADAASNSRLEAVTDNHNRTAPELRVLFKKGQLGASGSNKFLFDHVGLVEAHTAKAGVDLEEAAIEAGANEVEPLAHAQNDDIPADATGARFITDRTNTHGVSKWLAENGWTVVTSELGYVPKQCPELSEEQRAEVGAFLQALDDHDDVHRVWAAVK
jgi:transcriptional/translational regulatory protein YebC/TACO1